MKRWRTWVVVVIILGVVALIVMAFLPKPIPVDIVRARRGTLEVTLDQEGKTRV